MKSLKIKREQIRLIILIMLISLMLASAASAFKVTTDKEDYIDNQKVQIGITDCVGTSILQIKNSNGELIGVEQGLNSWNTIYNTLSDPSDGKYALYGSCASGDVYTKEFCVNSAGCTAVKPAEAPKDSGAAAPSGGSGGGGGGGGKRCTPEWSYSPWTYCNITLQKSRTGIDLKGCVKKPLSEVVSCPTCDVSWFCGGWSDAVGQCGTRKCVDEHGCGTSLGMPETSKACVSSGSGYTPQVQEQYKPAYSEQPEPQQPSGPEEEKSILPWILGGVGALLLLILIVVLIVHFVHAHKKTAYNVNDLKEWIRKEKEAGTPDADIRQILKENTGWTDEEINRAF